MKDLIDKVVRWAEDRNIIAGSSPEKQYAKLNEEVGELGIAIGAHDVAEIRDAIGDSTVVLILIAEIYGFTIEECLGAAYEEIKDRRGQMVNGKFVKEVV